MLERNKLHLSEKIHFDRSQPFGSASKGSDKLEGSVVPGENGKVHFESRFSSAKEFRPGCKMVPHMDRCPDDVVIPKKGPQLHTLKFTAYNPYRDRRHLTDSDIDRKDYSVLSNTGKKIVKDDKNGSAVSQFRSSEGNMETTFNRKQRVKGDRLRNGIPVANRGDKSYNAPERSVGFYKEGGLVVGSSINPRPERKLKGSKDSAQMTKSLKSLTASEKRENELSDSDRHQVEILTKAHYKRGQELPSWEERTGMRLCDPEDDED